MGVAHDLEMRLHDPVLEHECAVAHEVAGPREQAAVLLVARSMQRVRHRVREQPQEIRRRVRELDRKRVVVERANAERVGRQLARGDLVGVLDRREDERVRRQRRGIDAAAHAEHEVVGRDRVAVRPLRVLAQMERVDLAVGAHVPGLRGAGREVAVRLLVDEALEEVALDVRARELLAAMRVERLDLGAVAEVQHLALGELGAARPADLHAARAAVSRVVAATACERQQHHQRDCADESCM
jgi:hypothetical protein